MTGNYRELYNSLSKAEPQRLITEFTIKSVRRPNVEHDDNIENVSSDEGDIEALRKKARVMQEDTDSD